MESKLKIFITGRQQLDTEDLHLIEACSNARITKSLGDADIIFNVKDRHFFISSLTNTLEFKIPSITFNAANLKASFKLLYDKIHPKTFDRSKKKTELTKELNKVATTNKRISSLLTKMNNPKLALLNIRKEDLVQIYEKTTDFQDFPIHFLDLTLFKTYNSCQVIVHEKGKLTAFSYASDRNNNNKIFHINIGKFNSLHSMIKKSKNRLFQADVLSGNTLFNGTFLAKDYAFEGHTVVLMVSRNDFLPPSNEEQSHFFEFCNLLSPLFKQLTFIEQLENKNLYLESAVENLNRAIAVTDKNQNIIFKNQVFEHNEEEFKENLSKHFLGYPVSGRNKLMLHKHDISEVASQLFHFQRINLLGELLNTLQHELSNPLFGIRLSGELLEADCEDDETAETIHEINQYTKRCQTIIENFSYLYKDEQRFTEVNLKKLINETIILTKSETKMIGRTVNLPEEEIIIESNPTWISQIVFNLMINSSQAIKEYWQDNLSKQNIDLTLTIEDDKIVLAISDTGPGIPKEAAEKIFTPFHTTKTNGTGLGLSICKNLAQKLRGKLSLGAPHLGCGATFILELPYNPK